MWDRARDIVQILVIPTIMWSLWVSRGVEIQRLQLEQSTAELADLKIKVNSLEERAGTTRERLGKIETKLEGMHAQLERIERMLERITQEAR